MTTPVLVSIQVGLPQTRGTEGAADPMDQPWTSGFVKEPVHGPVRVSRTSLDGDGQADLRVHGGVDKAILAYSAGHYPLWRDELGMRDLPHGAFGENFTIAGLDERTVCIGDVWQIGRVRAEVSQPRQPCWKLARRWRRPDLPGRVIENGRSGWYFRVSAEGDVAAGDTLTLLERPSPCWTVAEATDVMLHRATDQRVTSELAELAALAESWRVALRKRLAG